MDGVAVDEQHASAEVLARAPQRVGVVPLLRLRVEDRARAAGRGARELGQALVDPLGREAGHDHDLVEPDAREVARARRRGSCGRRRPASSVLGRSAVSTAAGAARRRRRAPCRSSRRLSLVLVARRPGPLKRVHAATLSPRTARRAAPPSTKNPAGRTPRGEQHPGDDQPPVPARGQVAEPPRRHAPW